MYLNKNISNSNMLERANELLDLVNLSSRSNHYPKELSGGESQRIALARALANNPDIILADEPTGNLDKKNEKYIFDLLKKQSESGRCVIVVSHNEKMKKYADIILKLEGGNLFEIK